MSDPEEYEYTARIRNFSDENLHKPGTAAKIEIEPQEYILSVFHVFTNGMNAEDEGYVTLDYSDYEDLYCETSCVISVLDASGNRRFPTSYVFCPERENNSVALSRPRTFIMDRIMKRKTLLEESDELLPEDCLTLHFHVLMNRIIFEDDIEVSDTSFEFPSIGDQYARLPLDSVLAKRLMGVSSYFRALSEAPMVERQRGYATFSQQEYALFRRVCDILFRKHVIIIYSVQDLLQIYAAADQYDVQPVVDSCRGILSLLLGAAENDLRIKEEVMEEIPEFLELPGTLSDVRLKEILESFLERNSDEVSGTEESAGDRLEAGWRLEPVDEHYSYFRFTNELKREDEFKFYH